MIVKPGATDVTLYLFVVGDASNANPGDPITGLAFGDVTTFAYTRERTVETTFAAITLASPSAVHADGGFIEVDATNSPGLYRVDIPDAAVATGSPLAEITAVFAGAKNVRSQPIFVELNVGAVWDVLGSNHVVDDSMGEKMKGLAPAGGDVSGTPTSSVFETDLPGVTDDDLKDQIVVFVDGNLEGAARRITGNVINGTNEITVAPAFSAAPAVNDRCILVSVAQALGIADAVWDELVADHADDVPGKFGGAIAGLVPKASQTPAVGGSPTTTAFDSGLTEADDFWIGSIVVFTSGNLAGQARRITDYANTNGRITVGLAFAAAPAVDSEFVIISASDVLREPLPELAAVPAASPPVGEALMWEYMQLRNRKVTDDSGSPTKAQVFNDAGTKIADANVTDTGAGGLATREKYS